MANFFGKIKDRKEQKARAAASNEMKDTVEGRIRQGVGPLTEEAKSASPGSSVREYYDIVLLAGETSEIFYSGWWLISDFYYKNRGMGKEFVVKAVAAYTALVKGYHKAGDKRPKFIEGLSGYLNADESHLLAARLQATALLEPVKALAFFKSFEKYYPKSGHCLFASEMAGIIESNQEGDLTALLAYLKGEEERLNGGFSQAKTTFLALAKGNSDHRLATNAWIKVGDLQYYQEKKYKEAIASYENAAARDGQGDDTNIVHFQIGECYRALADWEKSIESYGHYIMESEGHFRVDFAKFYMAQSHENLGHWDEATLLYQTVADMDRSYWKDKAQDRMNLILKHQQEGTLKLLADTLSARTHKS